MGPDDFVSIFKLTFTPLNLVQSSPFDLQNDQQDRAHLLKATCVFDENGAFPPAPGGNKTDGPPKINLMGSGPPVPSLWVVVNIFTTRTSESYDHMLGGDPQTRDTPTNPQEPRRRLGNCNVR